jgi:hypothetical protein
VFFPHGTYLISAALTYGTNVTLRGAGMGASTIKLKAGTTTSALKSADGSVRSYRLRVQDLTFECTTAQTTMAGAIVIEGTEWAKVLRCEFNGFAGYGVKVLGGSTQGDAMYSTVAGCVFTNMYDNNTVAVLLTPSTRVPGGSHPDGALVTDNMVQSALGIAFRLDAPAVDSAGALGCDNCEFMFNRTIEVPTAFDVVGQAIRIGFNRCERTSGTMVVNLRVGTTNFPSGDILLVGNGWPTHASPGSFTFTDSALRTVRIADFDSGGTHWLATLNSGDTTQNVRQNGDTGDRFSIRSDARLQFGSGTGAVDAFLYRIAGPILRTESEINTLLAATGSTALSANVSGEAGRRWKIIGTGEFDIGPGDGTFDTKLYRNGIGDLKTDTGLTVGTFLKHLGTTLGFYGAAAVTKASAYTQTYATATRTHSNPTAAALTDAFGTADGTIADVGAAFNQGTLNDNFKECSAQINALIADLANVKQLLNSVIDDAQALGLVG